MDDMDAFDRQLASAVLRRVGPPEPVDDAAIFQGLTTAARSPLWRFQSMFSATRFVVAGAIVALFGGLVISSTSLWRQPDQQPPAAVATSPAASATSAPASLPPPEATATTGPVPDVPDEAMVMGPSEGDRLGGYREVGRFGEAAFGAESIGGVVGPVAIGDRLVMVVRVNDEDGRFRDVILQTKDGMTWLPSTVPGSTPWIDDLSATSEGLLAVGHDGVYPDLLPRLWASEDGNTWTMLEAPPDDAYRFISTADPLAVAGAWLWVQGDDGDWVKGLRLTNMDILAGPGGFLAWDARAGEGTQPFLMHSTDLLEWEDVVLPSPGSGDWVNDGDFGVYATGEEWILVPSRSVAPDSILTSRDGRAWEEAPRPPQMEHPRWIAAIADEVHAFQGLHDGLDGGSGRSRVRLWTWRLGETAAAPEQARPRRSFAQYQLGPPIEWQGDWVSLVFEVSGPRAVVLWRYEGGADAR